MYNNFQDEEEYNDSQSASTVRNGHNIFTDVNLVSLICIFLCIV